MLVQRFTQIGDHSFADAADQIGLPEAHEGLGDGNRQQRNQRAIERREIGLIERGVDQARYDPGQRKPDQAVENQDYSGDEERFPIRLDENQQPAVAGEQPAEEFAIGQGDRGTLLHGSGL